MGSAKVGAIQLSFGMDRGSRALYRSPSGDTWHLIRDAGSGRVLVRHQPNMASGGQASDIEIVDFLKSGRGPEHQELLRLIGTLLD
jgi:hypothetical protein